MMFGYFYRIHRVHRIFRISPIPSVLIFSILPILIIPVKIVFAADAYEIRAERMETAQEGEAVRRTYTGRVEALLDSVSVRSGKAVYTSATEEVIFSDGVEATDSARRVLADTLVYSLKDRRAVASGRVVVTEGRRELRAARAVFLRSSNRIQAVGRVEVWYPERKVRLSADSLEVEPGGDSGLARGRPRLTRADADTFAMAAEVIRFVKGGGGAEGEGEVEMTVGGFIARCSRAACDSDSVAMTGTPLLRQFQRGSDGADSSEVSAARVGLRTVDGGVRYVTAVGEARIVQRRFDAAGAPSAQSRLEGDTVSVEVERGAIRRAVSRGTAKSVCRDADSSEVELTAGTIAVAFEGGRVRLVNGEGQGKAFHVSADGSERSSLAGDRIDVEMDGDRIGNVLLKGHALCEYLPDDRAVRRRGGKSRLSSDCIRLTLKEGALRQVTVEGGGAGTYWMTEEEREGK